MWALDNIAAPNGDVRLACGFVGRCVPMLLALGVLAFERNPALPSGIVGDGCGVLLQSRGQRAGNEFIVERDHVT